MLRRMIPALVTMSALAIVTAGCDEKTGSQSTPATPVAGTPKTKADPTPIAARTGHEADKPAAASATRPASTKPAIAQKICPVMGGEIDPEVYLDHAGRRVYFCCEPCKDKFKADPAKYLAKLDQQLSAGTKPSS